MINAFIYQENILKPKEVGIFTFLLRLSYNLMLAEIYQDERYWILLILKKVSKRTFVMLIKNECR